MSLGKVRLASFDSKSPDAQSISLPSGNNGAWQKRISAENIIARWFGVTKEARKSYFRRNEGAFSRGSSV